MRALHIIGYVSAGLVCYIIMAGIVHDVLVRKYPLPRSNDGEDAVNWGTFLWMFPLIYWFFVGVFRVGRWIGAWITGVTIGLPRAIVYKVKHGKKTVTKGEARRSTQEE